MARRTTKRRPPPSVRVSYEPNRLADACLADAYEHIAPVVRRVTMVSTTAGSAPPAPVPPRHAAGGKQP
jgi:hypothetical protein